MKAFVVYINSWNGYEERKSVDSVWTNENEADEYIRLWNAKHKVEYPYNSDYLEYSEEFELDSHTELLNLLRKGNSNA